MNGGEGELSKSVEDSSQDEVFIIVFLKLLDSPKVVSLDGRDGLNPDERVKAFYLNEIISDEQLVKAKDWDLLREAIADKIGHKLKDREGVSTRATATVYFFEGLLSSVIMTDAWSEFEEFAQNKGCLEHLNEATSTLRFFEKQSEKKMIAGREGRDFATIWARER